MTQIEKIKAEIERRKNQFVFQAEAFHKIGKEDKESYYAALASNMNSLSCFLDSLEEDPVSNDLEEAAMQYAKSKHKDTTLQQIVSWDFKAGAQWQKEQMMKGSVEGYVRHHQGNVGDIYFQSQSVLSCKYPYKYGDKVKLIIIREE